MNHIGTDDIYFIIITDKFLTQDQCMLSLFFMHTKLVNKTILGAVSIRKTVLPGMSIPMLKIRRPNGRLIFNMEIAIRR